MSVVVKALEFARRKTKEISNEHNVMPTNQIRDDYQQSVMQIPQDEFIIESEDIRKAMYLNEYFMKFSLLYCGYDISSQLSIQNIIENITEI